jgi:hypothetical protein
VDAFFQVKLANFLKIHLADNLSNVDQLGLVELENCTVGSVYQVCTSEAPTKEDLAMLQTFYRYYQGPVPAKLVGKITPAEPFPVEPPAPNC